MKVGLKKVATMMMTVCILAGTVTGCTAASAQKEGQSGGTRYISIATSSSGGAFSIIGTAMSDIINKNLTGVSANIEITGGSSENLLLAEKGDVELAMAASDVLALALEGKGSFEGKKISKDSIKGVMGGHLTTLQVYTLKEGGILSFSDLKGKKIAVGPAGSVAGDAMKAVMDAYGYEINKDWTPEYLAHGDGAEALTDGNVDAVCIMSTLPASPVATAAASKELRLLDIDEEPYEKILKDCPYYLPASIEANVYNGQDTPVEHSIGSASIMVASSEMSEEDIYQIVKALFEHNDSLVAAYPQCTEWSVENATRGMEGLIDMHPGALRYLKEIGAMK